MRERHPIDELFKEALFDAELSPPRAVRDGLGAKMGWTSSSRSGFGLLLITLLLGSVGAGMAVWTWKAEAITESRTAVQAIPERSGVANYTDGTMPPPDNTALAKEGIDEQGGYSGVQGSENAPPKQEVEAADHVVARSANNKAEGVIANNPLPVQPTGRSYADRSSKSETTTLIVAPVTVKGVDDSGPGSHQAQVNLEQRAEPGDIDVLQSTASGSVIGTDARAFEMDPHPIGFGALPEPGVPAHVSVEYFVKGGSWWMGPYAGMGITSGTWKGATADELREAEKWGSSWQAGLLVGRTWRSGWSVAAGVGVDRLRSSFYVEQQEEGSNVLDVDTGWTSISHSTTGVTLFTWDIDTMEVFRPGAIDRISARNHYTFIQVPATVRWNTHFRRLRFEAFGGVSAMVPVQRTGITLRGGSVDGSSTIALEDPAVKDRFAWQLHGLGGVGLGWSVTEHLGVYVEPQITLPIHSASEQYAIWLTRPSLQFRIQYDLQ